MKKLLMILLIGMAGCGSISRGSTQKISVSSVPDGAIVKVDGVERGTTPMTLELKRKTLSYNVQIVKVGYLPYNVNLNRETQFATANAFIDFGLISHLLIDKGTGGAYVLKPDTLQVNLQR